MQGAVFTAVHRRCALGPESIGYVAWLLAGVTTMAISRLINLKRSNEFGEQHGFGYGDECAYGLKTKPRADSYTRNSNENSNS